MECKKVKELLMTDYADGELSEKLHREIIAHLGACPECRRFEIRIKESAVNPIRKADREYPPSYLFGKIKDKIYTEREAASVSGAAGLRSGLSRFFSMLRPALAVSAVAVAVFGLVVLMRPTRTGNGSVNLYLTEQAEFIAGLGSETTASLKGDLGTSIEEFLLS